MNVAIFGTKNEAIYLYKILRNKAEHRVVCFIDNNHEKQGHIIEGLEIRGYTEVASDDSIDTILVAIRSQIGRLEILKQISQSNKKKGVLKLSSFESESVIDRIEDAIFWITSTDKPVLPYLEYNVTDSCNLKCKGCTHFSNLIEGDGHADISEFASDIKRLSMQVQILELRLLGGEPLLHPHIIEFIEIARKYLPETDIEIVSNGLLIPKMNEDLFYEMNKNKVGFHITSYIPTMKIRDKIEKISEQYKLSVHFTPEIVDKFCRNIGTTGDSNPNKSQKACMAAGCRFLRNGRIYKCPTEGLIDIFADKYGYSVFPDKRGVDIYSDLELSEVLNEMLNPSEMCRFCAEELEWFDWKVETHPSENDWIVKRK